MTKNLFSAITTYTHPKILTVLLLGFSSGLPRLLVASTLGAWLIDSDVEKAAIGLFAYVAIPYSFNFIWAPIVDHVKLPLLTARFGRRTGWMLLAQALLMALLLCMGTLDPSVSPFAVAAVALGIGFFSATQDIVIDAYRTELLEQEQYGQGAAVAVFGYRLGMLVAGAGALYLAAYIEWSVVYPAMAACMLVGMATVLVAGEPGMRGKWQVVSGKEEEADTITPSFPVRDGGNPERNAGSTHDNTRHPRPVRSAGAAQPRVGDLAHGSPARPSDFRPDGLTGDDAVKKCFLTHAVVDPFKDFAQRHAGWWWILLFILFYRVPDGFIGFMTTPFLLDIGFEKTTVASIGKLYGFGATIAGMFIGGALIGKLGVMRCLWWFLLFQIGANLMYAVQAMAGANAELLVLTISVDNLSGGMVTAAAIAYMMSLCNLAYTATQYALLSSLASLASILLAGSAGWIAQAHGWEVMFALSAAMGLPALVLWWRIKDASDVSSRPCAVRKPG